MPFTLLHFKFGTASCDEQCDWVKQEKGDWGRKKDLDAKRKLMRYAQTVRADRVVLTTRLVKRDEGP